MLSPRPRALELGLPDGIGFGHPLFYIMLGFLGTHVQTCWCATWSDHQQVAFILMPSNTGLSFIASHLKTLLMYTIG